MRLQDGLEVMVGRILQVISHEVRFLHLISVNRLIILGLFAGTIGTRRLLKLFEKNNMKATWFIPGHSLETFPEECAIIRDAGRK
jgi:hypothetical protein